MRRKYLLLLIIVFFVFRRRPPELYNLTILNIGLTNSLSQKRQVSSRQMNAGDENLRYSQRYSDLLFHKNWIISLQSLTQWD